MRGNTPSVRVYGPAGAYEGASFSFHLAIAMARHLGLGSTVRSAHVKKSIVWTVGVDVEASESVMVGVCMARDAEYWRKQKERQAAKEYWRKQKERQVADAGRITGCDWPGE